MSAGFVEVLLKWSCNLQTNNKELPVIDIPADAWKEFSLALEDVFGPVLGVKMADEFFLEDKGEVQIVGFKFRRSVEPWPIPHPLFSKWDGRY